MTNKIPTTVNGLIGFSAQIIGGATEHGTDIGLVRNTPVNMTADHNALLLKRDEYEAARAALTGLYAGLDAATAAARAFIMQTRDLLKPHLGTRYSSAWISTGFNGSLEVRRQPSWQLATLTALAAYLTNNPAREIAELNITAIRAGEHADAVTAAQNAVNTQKGVVKGLWFNRNDALKALTKRMSDLIAELKQCLAPNDERWLAFGLNRPGAKQRPPVPTNIIAVLIGPSAVSVKWDASPRADYYRVWKRVVNSESELASVGSPADLDYIIDGLPGNSIIEIAVSAKNDGGESPLSEVITISTL